MSDHDLMGFLDELERALVVMPDESTTQGQIRRAASLARSNRSLRRHRRAQLVAAAIAGVMIVGTGSAAVAGGLPRWVQSLLSDTGRVLPVPVRIPPPSVPEGAYTDETWVIEEQMARAAAAMPTRADESEAGMPATDAGQETRTTQNQRRDSGNSGSGANWCPESGEHLNAQGSDSGFSWHCRRDDGNGFDFEIRDHRSEGTDRDWSKPQDDPSWDREDRSWDQEWHRRTEVRADEGGYEQDAGAEQHRNREESDGNDHDEHEGSHESRWRDRH